MSQSFTAPDLTQRPPRSPRVRLGGFVILPRMLDKGRATIAGTSGEYKFACPVDQHFLGFVGIDADALEAQLRAGPGDAEVLAWVQANARHRREPWEIEPWSQFQERRAPAEVATRQFFDQLHQAAAAARQDVVTWFDLLDLDDHVTFGGQA